MGFFISTDSTSDISNQVIEKYGIKVIYMPYTVGDEEFGGDTGKQMPNDKLFESMINGLKTSTSLISEERAYEYFTQLVKEGKDVLHIAFSSAISGTYTQTFNAAKRVNEENANKVYVVDSRAAALGEGLYVEACAVYAQEHDYESTIKYAEDLKFRMVHMFTVDDLRYLAMGGRISKASANIGNALRIKPVMYVDDPGALILGGKVISRRISLNKLIGKIKEQYTGEFKKIYVAQGYAMEDAIYCKEKLADLGAEVEIGEIGPVIGCHTGPGTIAIFCVGKNKVFNND
ncbi:MAG: DegV family protein [Clostridia bacterium]|nr:DegV family protein [Clostridia bacterium]